MDILKENVLKMTDDEISFEFNLSIMNLKHDVKRERKREQHIY